MALSVTGILVNCLGGVSLPKNSAVRLTDYPNMTVDVYHGGKANKHTHTQASEILPLKTEFL